VIAAGLLVVSPLAACGSTCSDLQLVCEECRDPNRRGSCEALVDQDVDDACEADLEAYRDICNQ
jgi:hypothetical protein